MDVSTAKRLSFIRYLHSLSLEQSRLPEPLSAISILQFHDTVELFLGLAAERRNVLKRGLQFADYFKVLDEESPDDPVQLSSSMLRLNSARVELKHRGTFPSPLAIQEFQALVSEFFRLNTPVLFGVEFDAVSLADLVMTAEVRTTLHAAESAMAKGECSECLNQTALAFEQLVKSVGDRTRVGYERPLLEFGGDFRFDRSFHRRRDPFHSDDRDNLDDKIIDTIESMQSALRIVALGLDYGRYGRFRMLTPRVTRVAHTYSVNIRSRFPFGPPCEDHCRFCIDFVVESALKVEAVFGAFPEDTN